MSLERFAADENFNNAILRGLQRQRPSLNIVRIQDTVIYQADDPAVLEWITEQNRILLTHDVKTMPKYAYERIKAQKPTPGIFVVNNQMSIGQAIEELILTIEASEPEEWHDTVEFFPL